MSPLTPVAEDPIVALFIRYGLPCASPSPRDLATLIVMMAVEREEPGFAFKPKRRLRDDRNLIRLSIVQRRIEVANRPRLIAEAAIRRAQSAADRFTEYEAVAAGYFEAPPPALVRAAEWELVQLQKEADAARLALSQFGPKVRRRQELEAVLRDHESFRRRVEHWQAMEAGTWKPDAFEDVWGDDYRRAEEEAVRLAALAETARIELATLSERKSNATYASDVVKDLRRLAGDAGSAAAAVYISSFDHPSGDARDSKSVRTACGEAAAGVVAAFVAGEGLDAMTVEESNRIVSDAVSSAFGPVEFDWSAAVSEVSQHNRSELHSGLGQDFAIIIAGAIGVAAHRADQANDLKGVHARWAAAFRRGEAGDWPLPKFITDYRGMIDHIEERVDALLRRMVTDGLNGASLQKRPTSEPPCFCNTECANLPPPSDEPTGGRISR